MSIGCVRLSLSGFTTDEECRTAARAVKEIGKMRIVRSVHHKSCADGSFKKEFLLRHIGFRVATIDSRAGFSVIAARKDRQSGPSLLSCFLQGDCSHP